MQYNRSSFKFNSRQARQELLYSIPLHDPYNGRIIEHGEDWDADHVLPLSLAWEWGAKHWNYAKLVQFANDPDNLVSTSDSSNRSKGGRSISEWIPLNIAYIPEMFDKIKSIADKYGLIIPESDLKFMLYVEQRISKKYKHGINIGRVRRWFASIPGLSYWAIPF